MGNIESLLIYSKKIKLLYVEDNLEARESTLQILEEFFDEIIVAVNGKDGLDKFKSHMSENNPFELIITDINMPVMNGLEMVRHIKKINDAIPVLVFSAYNESHFFIEGIKSGVDGYLLKPFDIAQFTSLLDKITQKIKLQIQTKKSENLLQQYKDITDKSTLISIIDSNEIITYANEAFCKIIEYSQDEVIGLKYHFIFKNKQSKELNDEIWSTIKDKKQIWQGVTTFVSKSGRLYYLKNTIKPILGANNEIIEYIALRDDITDIHLLAEEKEKFLILEKEQADKSNQAKSQFLSSISHELRTPMNVILGFAQILQYDDNLNEDQQDSVDEILKAGKHLLDLINEILDLATIESGKIKLSLEPVKLSLLVEECFTLIAPLAIENSISIHHDDMNGYFVHADKIRLKQILLNLLSNAIKYNRKQGSVNLKISSVNNNEIRITIIDTGNGIAENQLEDLFQPFNRLNSENSGIEGTGIGLAITSNLIEIMGGRVGVNSQLNIGSQFWLELPMETYKER